jgi:hypothetical protein
MVAPARVYVGSILRVARGDRSAYVYNGSTVGDWFLERLGHMLGQPGEWIPNDTAARSELARRLAQDGTNGSCIIREQPIEFFPVSPSGALVGPKLIEETKITPLYPRGKLQAKELGDLLFSAVIREDGVISQVQLVSGGTPNDPFTAAGAAALSLWRYVPAMLDGCPVSARVRVYVRFQVSQG